MKQLKTNGGDSVKKKLKSLFLILDFVGSVSALLARFFVIFGILGLVNFHLGIKTGFPFVILLLIYCVQPLIKISLRALEIGAAKGK